MNKNDIQDNTLRKAQQRMLSMALEIHKICIKHDINYWLDYGTLLGAVRHDGFIPWDDDFDISVELSDFEKLCTILKKELPNNLKLQDQSTEKFYPMRFAKVRDRNSIVYDDFTDTHIKEKGLFIDIFPVEKGSIFLKKAIHFFYYRLVVNIKFKNSKKGKTSKLVSYITWPCIYFAIKVARLFNFLVPKDQIIGAYGTVGLYWTKFNRKDIFPLKIKKFEGHNFLVPKDSDKQLKKLYGDYMKMPPVKERKIHATKIDFL